MNNTNTNSPIPVGFRFHPTDEELVGYYLHGKVERAQRDQLIQELDLYKIEPWDLHEVCRIGDDAAENQTDWYFFSRKDKKYPTGNRANRATTAGFWKATGRDKAIHTQHRHVIGMRKTLVFYKGRAPHGQKSDWIMHEFRLDEGTPGGVPNYGTTTELDGWVVCRVFRKTKVFKTKSQDTSCSLDEDQNQLLPGELLSPPPTAVNLIYHDNNAHPLQHPSFTNNNTCKQEISVDDYGTPPQDSPPYFPDSALLHHLQVDQEFQMRLSHPANSLDLDLAPCSSSSLRALNPACRPRADQCEYSVLPFDDARSTVTHEASAFPGLQCEESPFWMQPQLQMDGCLRTATRGDQTLADVTCHVGRMKRQATDHLTSSINLESHLVHLWNV